MSLELSNTSNARGTCRNVYAVRLRGQLNASSSNNEQGLTMGRPTRNSLGLAGPHKVAAASQLRAGVQPRNSAQQQTPRSCTRVCGRQDNNPYVCALFAGVLRTWQQTSYILHMSQCCAVRCVPPPL
eukprot:365314-Chlamydomonas_euryale.AAC.3